MSNEDASTPRGLHEKLAEIAAELHRFPKTERVAGKGGYAFAGVDAMADAIRPAMAERGVVMYPEQVDLVECAQYVRQRVNAGGEAYETVQWRTVVRATWVVSDGREAIRIMSVGEALDTSDKSANKAQTAARKYAMIGLLNVTTGDEPDPDSSRPGDDGEQARPRPSSPPPPPPAPPRMPDDEVKTAFREKLRAANAAFGEEWRTTFTKWLASDVGAPLGDVTAFVGRMILDDELEPWPPAMHFPRVEKVYGMLTRKLDEHAGASS